MAEKEKVFTEDAFDEELYKLRTVNSKKSIAAVFIYMIVKSETSPEHPMTQQKIIKRLAAAPIEIKIDRKSASRIIYTLADSGVGVLATPDKGVWFDENSIWYNKAA